MPIEDNKTHAEIIAEMRFHGQQNIDAEKDKPEFGILTMEGRIVQNYANELEAAHKRDVDKLNSVIQATVSHSDAEIDRLRREVENAKVVGNAAKLCEAMESILNIAYEVKDANADGGCRTNIPTEFVIDTIKNALAAPQRNCDLYGGDYKMLHTKWSEWTASPSGRNPNNTMKMTFSEWLLAPANEKGATDGSK